MSQRDVLIERLRSRPRDFTIDELDSLMRKCGCKKVTRGKTSGSAIAYIHEKTGKKLKFHSPHPQKELKMYMIDMAIGFLSELNEI